jgi:hypothetical protein
MSDSLKPSVAANDASASSSREGRGEEAASLTRAPSPRPSPARGEGVEGGEGDELPIDPEIEALLEFEPVPRKVKRPDGWFPHLQREFVHRLALCGVPSRAADQMGKNVSGIEAIYRQKGGETLRAAWDAALELWRRRNEALEGAAFEGRAPGINVRSGAPSPGASHHPLPLPGQVLNEHGEWEDEESLQRRGEDAADSIRGKLLRCRRLFLQEISGSPGKRAAFEILTELAVDWDKAAALEPQPDEPFNRANQRQPDMILTAESGWAFGELGYGPDRKAQARIAIDEYRAEEGLPAVNWATEEEGEGTTDE